LDIDELNELEASLSRTSIQIREPGEGTSSWASSIMEDCWEVLSIFGSSNQSSCYWKRKGGGA
jgi:hypothetical protein